MTAVPLKHTSYSEKNGEQKKRQNTLYEKRERRWIR